MEKFPFDDETEVWEAECDLDCLPALMEIVDALQDESLEGAFTDTFGIDAFTDGHLSILVKIGSNGLDEAITFLRTKGINIS